MIVVKRRKTSFSAAAVAAAIKIKMILGRRITCQQFGVAQLPIATATKTAATTTTTISIANGGR